MPYIYILKSKTTGKLLPIKVFQKLEIGSEVEILNDKWIVFQ